MLMYIDQLQNKSTQPDYEMPPTLPITTSIQFCILHTGMKELLASSYILYPHQKQFVCFCSVVTKVVVKTPDQKKNT